MTEWLGKHLDGKYHIESKVGEGGFGVVYRARQLSTTRLVAVKLIHPRVLQEGDDAHRTVVVERFRREMQLVARLDHPHIVTLIDSGGTAAANASVPLYAVFSYINGRTLTKTIQDEGCLSVYETRRLMFQVLEALAHAHSQGVFHRDIKPDNIMISGSIRDHRNAHVLDFGIAGVKSTAAKEFGLTQTGDAVGTPAYMAPEQLRDTKRTGYATDLYAWGLVYIEALTGARVVPGTSAWDAYAFHMRVDVEAVPPSLARTLDSRWLRYVTQPDPSDRPADAATLLDYIVRNLQDETPEKVEALKRARVGMQVAQSWGQRAWRIVLLVLRRLLGLLVGFTWAVARDWRVALLIATFTLLVGVPALMGRGVYGTDPVALRIDAVDAYDVTPAADVDADLDVRDVCAEGEPAIDAPALQDQRENITCFSGVTWGSTLCAATVAAARRWLREVTAPPR